MTESEKEIIQMLNGCRMLPGLYVKRVISSMDKWIKNDNEIELSEDMKTWLLKQLKRYRKQIPNTYNKYKHLISEK